jgi:hypothetical protein
MKEYMILRGRETLTSYITIWNKRSAVTRTAWVEKATSFAATGIICNN